ncbi:MAG: extracellular solute-binding protein [Candidatus Hydrogenedentes bacterium]|nr:extracellular solute-binding protein [Candidatus Hydrogenedentota bacterium]
MKHVFMGAFAGMLLLSLVAHVWVPASDPNRIKLIWACDDSPTRREQIALFNQMNPEYELTLDPNPGAFEKIMVQCLAGVGPDLYDSYFPWQTSLFARAGIAYDLTDELPKIGVDIDEIWPCAKNTVIFNNRVYGHPGNANAPAIWYNKRLFDEAGIPYPDANWKWDDFIAIAKKLTIRDERGRPVQYGFLGYWDWKSVLYQWGASMYTPEGTRCTLDSPESIAAFTFLQDLIFKHRVMPSYSEERYMARSGGWGFEHLNIFAAERGAMAIGGRWWLQLMRQPEFSKLRLGTAPLPAGPTRRIMGGARATIVNTNGKHLDAALKFIQCLHSKEWNELINKQADALAPVKKYCYTDEFLHDPRYPQEDYNQVWRDSLENAVPEENSPYVNGGTVDKILKIQTELIRLDQKSAEAGVRDATKLINEAIVDLLRMDPVIKEQYMEAVSNGARPAWDRPEDAP